MFKGKLKPFQKEGVEFGLKAPYHINNFQAGLGKTITSLALACRVGGPVLVVCPAFLKKNWIKEINKFTEGLNITLMSYAALDKFATFKVEIVRGKKIRTLTGLQDNLPYFNIVIGDEIHNAKNKEANRTQILHLYLEKMKPKYFIGLTGTPVANRVSEFWSLLQLCYYGGSYPQFKPFFRLYYKFCHMFSYERTFEVNGIPIIRFDGVKKKNRGKLIELIRPVLIRRRSDQVEDLPPEVEIDVVGDAKKYDEDLKKAFDLYQKDMADPAYMSLKSANALAKVGTTVKLAKELIEQGYRPLIFTCHRDSASELSRLLKCKKIDGNLDPDKRQDIIDEFNTGKPLALVATVKSASVGFNITSTNYTIVNDLPFSPDDIEQLKKRTKRIGQEKTCFYYYIYTSPMDKKLTDMVKRKEGDINPIMEAL